MRPGGRRGIEFFGTGSKEVPEAFAVEEADGDVVRELRGKTNQFISGTWTDCRGGGGERRSGFRGDLGVGPCLEDGLRE